MRFTFALRLGLFLTFATACGGKSGQHTTEPSLYEIIEIDPEVRDIAIDSNAVYWSDRKKSAVFRRGLNKSDIVAELATDVMAQAMTSDDANVFWVAYVDQNLDSLRLRVASKGENQVATLIPGGLDSTILPGAPLAAGGGYVYWQKYSQPTAILRIPTTGGAVEEFAGASSTAQFVDASLHGYPPQPLYVNNRVFEFLEDRIRVYDLSTKTGSTFFNGVMHTENACYVSDTLYVVGWPDNNPGKAGVWAIRDELQTLVTRADISARVACSPTTAYFALFDVSNGVGPVQIHEIDAASLTARLLLQLADSERGFTSSLAYGGNALALVSNSGSIRIPLDATK